MLLDGKRSIIYGAGGDLGGVVARTFAREGATVFLAGRTRSKLDTVAAEIGDAAHVIELDATDEAAVEAHADTVAQAGGIDVSLNLISRGDVQGVPLTEMTLSQESRRHPCGRVLGRRRSKGEVTDFYRATQAKDGETVIFSWIEYPDKATRDAANEKMSADSETMNMEMPFAAKRMFFGGFEQVVSE
jgi:NAD(P)-dependent dehydrogenase (short-subunit alcohol dehydrogenase family)